LSKFEILSGTIRLDDGRTLKGYKREDFEEAFEQYLPPQSVTTSQSNNDGHCDVVTVSGRGISKSRANGAPERLCSHCGRTGEDLQETYYGEASALLHRDCQDAWRTAYEAGHYLRSRQQGCEPAHDDLDIRNQPFYRPEP